MVFKKIKMRYKFTKILVIILCFCLLFEQSGFCQVAAQLDIAGHLNALHNTLIIERFRPLHLRYLQYNPNENNFKLLLDKGDTDRDGSLRGRDGSLREGSRREPSLPLKEETQVLLNYFFIGLALPNDTFWVNLRPAPLETKGKQDRDTLSLTGPDSPENIIDDA